MCTIKKGTKIPHKYLPPTLIQDELRKVENTLHTLPKITYQISTEKKNKHTQTELGGILKKKKKKINSHLKDQNIQNTEEKKNTKVYLINFTIIMQ